MKTNYFLILLAVFSVVIFGCTQSPTKAVMEKKDAMMDKEAGEMAEIGFEMQNGKMMMVDEKSKTSALMEKYAMLDDGTKVMTSGKVIKKDGTFFMLKENESIWMDGAFVKAGEMMENKSMMDKDKNMMASAYKGKVLAGTITPYLDFNKADYDKALGENKIILLNFYANWCPICKAEQPEAFGAFGQMNNSNIVGFRVNFRDSDTDADEENLAREFGIAYQHTKVILKNGQKVLKAPDSWDRQRYLDELMKV